MHRMTKSAPKSCQSQKDMHLTKYFLRVIFILRRLAEELPLNLGSDFQWEEPRFYFPIPQSELDTNQALQ
jgi:hypothetical protein